MTLKEITDMTLQLINQYSIAGSLVASSYNSQQDYLNRINLLVNDAQNIIATTTKKIFAQYVITQNPIPNALKGKENYFEVRQHLNKPISFKVDSASAYYFETDGEGTVEIRLQGVLVETIQTTKQEGFKAYKGVLIRRGDVEITFTGDYPYNFRNIALYDVKFKSAADVPAYQYNNAYEMPDDFFQLVGRGIPYTSGDHFCQSHEYAWVGQKTLLLKSDLKGEWKVDYYRYPKAITQTSDSATEMDNVVEAQLAIPYYVAAHLVMYDDSNASYILMNEWELKLSRLGESVQTTVSTIEDVYFYPNHIS